MTINRIENLELVKNSRFKEYYPTPEMVEFYNTQYKNNVFHRIAPTVDDFMLNSKNPDLFWTFEAFKSQLRVSTLLMMAHHKNITMNYLVALYDYAPTNALEVLSKHSDWGIRILVATHPNTLKETVESLKYDVNVLIRRRVEYRLSIQDFELRRKKFLSMQHTLKRLGINK